MIITGNLVIDIFLNSILVITGWLGMGCFSLGLIHLVDIIICYLWKGAGSIMLSDTEKKSFNYAILAGPIYGVLIILAGCLYYSMKIAEEWWYGETATNMEG